ncbi:MAG: discoidin domain-containing protein [Clostridia bacterium]|nr:discoidin domain-containing protein [Clostridia bacterium]
MKNARKLLLALLIAIVMVFVCAVSAMATPGEFNFDIAGTSVPTTLDGVISEGEYAGNAPIVVDGSNYYSDGSWVGSFKGEKYSFYFTWDADNLYVGVTVEGDTTPSQNGPEGGDWFRAGDMVQMGFNPDYQLQDCHPIILGVGFTADKQVQVRGDAFRSTVDGEQTKDITAEIPGYSKAYSADGINYCAELAIPWVDYIFVNGVGRSSDGAPLYDLTDLKAAGGLEIGLWLAMGNDADGPDGWDGDTCMRTDNSNGQAWVAQGMTSICLTLANAPEPAAPTYTYPASGESGNFLSGTVIGNATGWDGTEGSGTAAAFDGNPTSYFDPPSKGGDNWCGMDFGKAVVLEKVVILSRENWNARFNGATIDGSNDGENWTTLFQASGEGTNPDYYVITEFENNTGYSMYRYHNEVEHGDVAEIEFYGTDAPAAEAPAEAEPETQAEPEPPASSPVDEELEAKAEAPNTFDFSVAAAVAAVISLGGFALTKKKH